MAVTVEQVYAQLNAVVDLVVVDPHPVRRSGRQYGDGEVLFGKRGWNESDRRVCLACEQPGKPQDRDDSREAREPVPVAHRVHPGVASPGPPENLTGATQSGIKIAMTRLHTRL